VAWWVSALASAAAALVVGVSACGSSSPTGSPAAPTVQAAPLSSAPPAQPFVPGRTYVGRNEYVEFRAGDAPIVVSAPHGGALEPAEIPNRTSGTTVTDVATEELARLLASALQSRTGRQASLVVCRLKRVKLDVNREITEGAQGNPHAEQAWNEYHAFLDAAREIAAGLHGRALVVDLHGHSHPKARVEAGYLLGADELDRSDADLDGSGAA
jgi:N-formylglutamate amidohydrolase